MRPFLLKCCVKTINDGFEGTTSGKWRMCAFWEHWQGAYVFGEFCVVVLVAMWIFGRVKAHEEDRNPVYLLRHQDGGRGVCLVDEWGRNLKLKFWWVGCGDWCGWSLLRVEMLNDIHLCLRLLHKELKMWHKVSIPYVILSKTDKKFEWYVYWIWQILIIVVSCWQCV